VGSENVELSGMSFRYTYYLQDGRNNIAVTATDSAGNVTSQELSYFYDRMAPQIVITRPSNNMKLPEMPPSGTPHNPNPPIAITVTGFVQDPEPSSGIETMTINGQSVKLNRDNSFEYIIDSHKGEQLLFGNKYQINLVIQVRDRAGNETINDSFTIE
jgi:hypothetical protein